MRLNIIHPCGSLQQRAAEYRLSQYQHSPDRQQVDSGQWTRQQCKQLYQHRIMHVSLLCNIWTLGHNDHKGRLGGAAINYSLYLFAIGH